MTSTLIDTGIGEQSHVFTLNPAYDYPVLERGEGVYVYDTEGRQYLDAVAGIALASIGYGRQRVADVLARQAAKLQYAAPNRFRNQPAEELAARVARIAPGDLNHVHFVSGGSEATEVSLKMARQYQVLRGNESKHLAVSRWTSYHGATLGALSVGGSVARRKMYLPMLHDFPHIPPAFCYRCPFEKSYPSCELACAWELEKTIQAVGPEKIMAFIAEPIVGAVGGALVPPPEYFPIIRQICDRYDILMIIDEVITGFGRTGRHFGIEHWGVVPDILHSAKGLGGGYASIGCVIASDKVRSAFVQAGASFEHIFTYGGNPVSTAAANEVLKIWEEEKLTENAARVGEYLASRLQELRRHEIVGDVRSIGLMAAIEFVRDRDTKEPFPREVGLATRVGQVCQQHGLLTYPASAIIDGERGDIVSLFPPLIFTRAHVDEMMEKLNAALSEIGTA
jgi:adenosylmethionine-8-amino-7-oxononanoate aminotransferase